MKCDIFSYLLPRQALFRLQPLYHELPETLTHITNFQDESQTGFISKESVFVPSGVGVPESTGFLLIRVKIMKKIWSLQKFILFPVPHTANNKDFKSIDIAMSWSRGIWKK